MILPYLKTLAHRAFMVILFAAVTTPVSAQIIRGTVIDDNSKLGINEAVVGIESTDISVITNSNGEFELPNAPSGNQTLIITAENYVAFSLNVNVPQNGTLILDPTLLTKKEGVIINEVDDIPSISISVDDIENENDQSVSGLLSASRDAFLNAAAFTFGPARFRIRGYDSENTEVMLNGITFNSLENGRNFWGAWGGLNDVFRNRETDLGLASSSNAFGGVGGC